MSTLAPAPPTRPASPSPPPVPPSRRRSGRRRLLWLAPVLAGMIVFAPVVLFAGAGNPPCTTGPIGVTSPGGPAPAGMFAAPLQLQSGRWYRIGATEYGGPGDPTSGTTGSGGAYLPAHPDSFAELSVLDTNPANGGTFTFQDANALSVLPYGTNLRVSHAGHQLVLTKRDTGYGQGPGQTIPYRIDVWWQAAAQLGVTKSTVNVQLAPRSGSGGVLGQLPISAGGPAAEPASCTGGPTGPLPTTTSPVAQINPSTGIASAPASAPAAVKRAIAAANQIIDKPYIWGGGHANLNTLAAGYDCSGSIEWALHHSGLFAPTAGPASGAFEHYYRPGPGRWITVYANANHMWMQVAGIVLNTAWYARVKPTSPGTGPRWQPASTVQAQIQGNAAAGNPPFSVTHPKGL